MPKYEIRITESEIYYMEVEAATKYEAKEKAYKLIETEEGRVKYHDDSDSDVEIFDC